MIWFKNKDFDGLRYILGILGEMGISHAIPSSGTHTTVEHWRSRRIEQAGNKYFLPLTPSAL